MSDRNAARPARARRTMRARAAVQRPFFDEPPLTVFRVMSSRAPSAPARSRSKTLTALLAFLFGSVGAHRFYLYGRRDLFGWVHMIGTALGIPGVLMLVASHRSSTAGWVLAVLGASSLLAAFLAAIVYGLRPDEKWDAQFNTGSSR